MTDNAEWEGIKRRHHYRCCICRQPEKVTGTFLPLSLKEEPGNPYRTFPLCPDHHSKYMQGFFSGAELKKIGVSSESYQKFLTEKAGEPNSGSGLSAAEKVTQAKEATIKKIQKAKKTKMPKVHSDYMKMI
jgi:hypothetical protein